MPPNHTIETLNALPLADFRSQFWPSDNPINSPHESLPRLTLESASTIPPQDLDACFQLISKTSSDQYAASSLGWHPGKKRREMRLPDLKYALLKQESSIPNVAASGPSNRIEGFMSFMLTYEDRIEVIYCYEIHLEAWCRGKGMGKYLIERMEEVGRRAGVKKAMLTVFKANCAAMTFNRRMGYEVDDYSPRPKKLRGGVVKEWDYVILSKALAGNQSPLISEKLLPSDKIKGDREQDVSDGGSARRKRKAG